MMRLTAVLLSLVLAGCVATSSWPNRGSAYYYRSMPAYTYVDGYYGFPYYGPYAWNWYYPVWYSPMMGSHYSWRRPYHCWGMPYLNPAWRVADRGDGKQPDSPDPVRQPMQPVPILPVDLDQVVAGPGASRPALKPRVYQSAGMKQRSMVKSSKTSPSAYRSSRSSSSAVYRSPRPVSRPHSPKQSTLTQSSRNEY